MDAQLKNDIVNSWNEAEEITANFDQLSKEELIECLDAINQRARVIRDTLGKYVTDEDVDNL